MDEFIHETLNKKTRTLGVESFIATYKKFPVLASDNYMTNELARTQKDIILINPKSAIGQFFKEQIPKVDDLLKTDNRLQIPDEKIYYISSNNEPKKEEQKLSEPKPEESKEPVFAADDYKDSQPLPQAASSIYNVNIFQPANSWYNQNTNRPYLENILRNNSAADNYFQVQSNYKKKYTPRYKGAV